MQGNCWLGASTWDMAIVDRCVNFDGSRETVRKKDEITALAKSFQSYREGTDTLGKYSHPCLSKDRPCSLLPTLLIHDTLRMN